MPVMKIEAGEAGLAPILVEVEAVTEAEEDVYGNVRDGAADRVLDRTRDLFGEGLALARSCAIRVAEVLEEMRKESQPEEFSLQLAIKLDSQLGAVIARASASAQLQVQIKWKCDPPARENER